MRLDRPSAAKAATLARHTGALVLCLYLLTMAGHTSSPDEESFIYMARSLVEHGQLDIPEDGRATTALLAPGRTGRIYAPYGPVHPILLAPFYVAGDLASKAFDARMRGYVVRLATNLLDPILTAITAAVLLLLATELGASGAAAVALALAYAVGTIAWPYSKWVWSEPTAALAVLLALLWTSRATRRPGLLAPLLAGLAVAAAAGTKLPTSVIFPGFLLILAIPVRAGGARHGWSGCGSRLAAFALGPVVAGLALLALNFTRFGLPFETGYQMLGANASAFAWGSREGILGLLASPGKSLFLFSPPLLLGLAGLPRFSRRAPREAFLVIWIAATQVFIHGSFVNWHGDASWGPRYLVPLTAPLLLPALALLDLPLGSARRIARTSLAVLVIAGIAVGLPGVLLNYAAYTVRTDGDGGKARRFVARDSPVPGHYRLLAARLHAWRSFQTPDILLARGFSWPEGDSDHPLPRWTSAEAEIEVRTGGRSPVRLKLDYVGFRPRSLEPARLELSARGDGPLPTVIRFDPDSQRGTLSIELHPGMPDPRLLTLRVTNPWHPAADAGLPDERELGVFVERIRGTVNGSDRLTLGEALVPRLPVTEQRPWGKEAMAWFYEPPQLLDLWTWHVWRSGLPRALVLLAALPALGLIIEARALAGSLAGNGKDVMS